MYEYKYSAFKKLQCCKGRRNEAVSEVVAFPLQMGEISAPLPVAPILPVQYSSSIVPKYGYIIFLRFNELPQMKDAKEDKILKEFGKNLEKLRIAKKLSTREFAYLADISHSSVGRLEAGETNPSMTTLLKLAEALAVDLNTLVLKK
ncbi:helix-turn-helix domain-containing protein [Chitinophaga sp. RAB17]|uniref:helix-turn-helix domain-containing protein n=1 Tax=Chitinophaga sp. RAB17 TaxID=3233049 RepID=UPI003F906D7F